MMMEAEYVIPLFEACAEFQTQIGLRLIEKGVDAIWFGDDFGTQQSLIMAPETFRNQLKPVYTKMIQRFKVCQILRLDTEKQLIIQHETFMKEINALRRIDYLLRDEKTEDNEYTILKTYKN